MRRFGILSLGLIVGVSINLKAGFYEGMYGAVNEVDSVHYENLKQYSVVLDGKNISTVELLRIKGIAEKAKVPNVKYINNRFLVFGDFNRLPDAEFIWNRLKKIFMDKLSVKIANSKVFGDRVVVTPLIVRSFGERNKKGDHTLSFIADGYSGQDVKLEKYDEKTSLQGNIREERYFYSNKGWDDAISSSKKTHNHTSFEQPIDILKQAKIKDGFIVVKSKKVYVGDRYEDFNIVEVNAADQSFIVRDKHGEIWLVENNKLIKM